MKAIDLSIPTEESPSEPIGVKIDRIPHEEGAEFLCRFFGCVKDPTFFQNNLEAKNRLTQNGPLHEGFYDFYFIRIHAEGFCARD